MLKGGSLILIKPTSSSPPPPFYTVVKAMAYILIVGFALLGEMQGLDVLSDAF